MSSNSGKNPAEEGDKKPSDQPESTSTTDKKGIGDNADKSESKEAGRTSPNTPLPPRGATTTSSSSSSSGSFSGKAPHPKTTKKSESNPSRHTGAHSAGTSPAASKSSRKAHTRSSSCGPSVNTSVPIIPFGNLYPAGNVPTGDILKPPPRKPDIMGSATSNYGHGSIIWGHIPTFPESRSTGLMERGESAKKTEPRSDPEEFKRIGNECYKNGCFEEALALYEKAIAVAPDNATYHYSRGAALLGLNRMLEAMREFEAAISLNPGYCRAHEKLGSLLLSLGLIEDANKHICMAGRQLDPPVMQKLILVESHRNKCVEARTIGDWKTTLKEVDNAIASGADASPQLYVIRAEALTHIPKQDDALEALAKAESLTNLSTTLKIFGMLLEAYKFYVKTKIDLAQGRFDEALASIERAAQIDPNSTDISDQLKKTGLVCRARVRGNDLFKDERFTEATYAYGEGLKLDPSNPVLNSNRAACWFKLGQWKQSVDDCDKAIEYQPNYLKARRRRAESLCKLERWEEALGDYLYLRKACPNDDDIAEASFHATVAYKKSQGEDVSNMKFGGEVESVTSLEQFRAAISSAGATVVHFKLRSNSQCREMSPLVHLLCSRFPAMSFLEVDIGEHGDIGSAEKIVGVPTFNIYIKGQRVEEIICPSFDVLEKSVKRYNFNFSIHNK